MRSNAETQRQRSLRVSDSRRPLILSGDAGSTPSRVWFFVGLVFIGASLAALWFGFGAAVLISIGAGAGFSFVLSFTSGRTQEPIAEKETPDPLPPMQSQDGRAGFEKLQALAKQPLAGLSAPTPSAKYPPTSPPADVLEAIGNGILTTNRDGRVNFANKAARDLIGSWQEPILGAPVARIFALINEQSDRPQKNPVLRCLTTGTKITGSGSLLMANTETRLLQVQFTATPILDGAGTLTGAALVFSDASDQYHLLKDAEFRATHDALTGLMSRCEFDRQLKSKIERSDTNAWAGALAYVDLDQFKIVNDLKGHNAGDELLQQVAQSLHQAVGPDHAVARLGGDEFGILLNVPDLEAAEIIAERVRRAIFSISFSYEKQSFRSSASLGLVAINEGNGTSNDVLRMADQACYSAKDRGRNRVYVFRSSDLEVATRNGEMRWVNFIQRGLDEDSFHLHFQPIVPLSDPHQGTSACELLLRFADKNGRLIRPGAFMPSAERYGLANAVDRWVVRHAFDWLNRHKDSLQDLNYCSINLSSASLSDDTFADFLIELLDASSIPPERICFEVSEQAAISHLSNALRIFTRLKEQGCKLALDDFGAGLSSFAYLRSLPVDFLKIDGLFVRSMTSNALDYEMVRSMNEMAHILGVKTIAEYVHSPEILDQLIGLGIDYAQGHHFGRAKPIDLLPDHLRKLGHRLVPAASRQEIS